MLRRGSVLMMALWALAGCVSRSNAEPAGTATQTTAEVGSSTIAVPYDEILEDLREYIDVPGDPIAVRYGSVPIGIESDDRAPGPVDYQYLAMIKYATTDEVLAVAGPADGPGEVDEVLIGDFFDDELVALGTTGEWDRHWLAVTVHHPESDWVDWVGVVDGAPQYIIVEYRPQSM